ncbi:unnamed protein product, partial [marine sediment metagenome]
MSRNPDYLAKGQWLFWPPYPFYLAQIFGFFQELESQWESSQPQEILDSVSHF